MFQKKLQYMMDNNPDITLTKKSSDIRKKIRPYFMRALKLANPLDLTIEKKVPVPKDRPIIYIASHGFKDDVLNTILTVNDDAYVVFGNIDLFYHTFDGVCLWIYGTQLVNRYDKDSKHAMKNKMNTAIEYGNNIIIFSEATWNLSEHKPMENLHWGYYDIAIKNNALIVPVLTYKVGKKCYSRMLEPLDITKITEEDKEDIIVLIKKCLEKIIDLDIYHDNIFKNILAKTKELLSKLETLQSSTNESEIKEIEKFAKEIIEELKNQNDLEDDIKLSAFNLIIQYFTRISNATKEVITKKIRNIMALEKVDMYKEHPDYTYMTDGKDMYEAWDDYIDETIHKTPYFYPEEEETTLCKDPLIISEEEVMPWLAPKKRSRKK